MYVCNYEIAIPERGGFYFWACGRGGLLCDRKETDVPLLLRGRKVLTPLATAFGPRWQATSLVSAWPEVALPLSLQS